MKILIAAVVLTIALPAAANAQAAQHADHAQHEGMDHSKDHKDCCKHKNADGSPMDCCKEKDGKMADCCKEHDQTGHDAIRA